MNGFTDFLKHNAKAIAGFVAGIVITAIQAVLAGQAPWPTTLGDWGKYLGSAVISGVLVWLTGNKLTIPQITKGAVQQGVTVITNTAIDTVADAAEEAVHNATESFLPDGIATPVNDVAQLVSATVANVMKGVASNFPDELLKTIA
jgi:hypothetical protein